MRTGIGYDIHRLIPTTQLSEIPLGGIKVPCFFKVEAHSDGDVLLHALIDACLGALALGDIGERFPNSDPKNHNRPSLEFLLDVKSELARLGWCVDQIDSVIWLEEPKLISHKDSMRRQIASALGMELEFVSVKAKTMEGLGPVGERRAVSAQVLVVLMPILQ